MKDFVKLQDITKIYKMGEIEIRAADNISFSIDKGEFVVIVGPSGAGKTTVLNILGGMDTATSGTLLVDGEEITAYNSRRLTEYRREDIGFVFQFYNLVPNLTALENVELALQICKDPLDADLVLDEVGEYARSPWLRRFYTFSIRFILRNSLTSFLPFDPQQHPPRLPRRAETAL